MNSIERLDLAFSYICIQIIALYYTPESSSAAFSRKLSKRKKASQGRKKTKEKKRKRVRFIGVEMAFRAIEHEAGSLYLTSFDIYIIHIYVYVCVSIFLRPLRRLRCNDIECKQSRIRYLPSKSSVWEKIFPRKKIVIT